MDVCAALPLRLTAHSCVRQGGAAEAEHTGPLTCSATRSTMCMPPTISFSSIPCSEAVRQQAPSQPAACARAPSAWVGERGTHASASPGRGTRGTPGAHRVLARTYLKLLCELLLLLFLLRELLLALAQLRHDLHGQLKHAACCAACQAHLGLYERRLSSAALNAMLHGMRLPLLAPAQLRHGLLLRTRSHH